MIGFDIDEVIYPWIEMFRAFVSRSDIQDLVKYPPPTKWSFWDEWGLTEEQFNKEFDAFISVGSFLIGDPNDGMVDYILNISEKEPVALVTARGFFRGLPSSSEQDAKQDTIAWLNHQGLGNLPIYFTDNKASLKLDILVDDAPHQLEAAREAGITGIAMDHPHNQTWDGLRAHTVQELSALIDTVLWQKRQHGSQSSVPSPVY